MTRDEAIKILDDNLEDRSKTINAKTIDCLVSLGILKLDALKPKSVVDIFAYEMRERGYYASCFKSDVENSLRAAGLKIVEK